MVKAATSVHSDAGSGNKVSPERLTTNQTAAALVALLNGARQVPAIAQLRSMVRRGLRARRIAANGGRHHG